MEVKKLLLTDAEIKHRLSQVQPAGFNWDDPTGPEMTKYKTIAQAQLDKVLSDPDICVKSKNQELPKQPYGTWVNPETHEIKPVALGVGYLQAQADMLKAGFVRVETKVSLIQDASEVTAIYPLSDNPIEHIREMREPKKEKSKWKRWLKR